MSTLRITQAALWEFESFRKLMIWSVAGHGIAVLVFTVGPWAFAPRRTATPVFVELVAAPAPAPPAAKKAPKQVVDEAVVIPKKPKELPKPEPKPEKKAEKPPEKKAPPAPDAKALLAQLREKVDQREGPASDKPATQQGGVGRVDPLLAAYKAKIQSCLYANWAGARPFSRRRDLELVLEVHIASTGKVKSVDLIETSGNRFLDQSAERSVWKCEPFDRPPPQGEQLLIEFNPAELT